MRVHQRENQRQDGFAIIAAVNGTIIANIVRPMSTMLLLDVELNTRDASTWVNGSIKFFKSPNATPINNGSPFEARPVFKCKTIYQRILHRNNAAGNENFG